MALIFTHSTFEHISKNLSSENGLWSLAMANEYLEPDHPIRRGLAKKFKQLHNSNPAMFSKIEDRIVRGDRVRELPAVEQQRLRESAGLNMKTRQRSRFLNALSNRQGERNLGTAKFNRKGMFSKQA